MSESKTTKFTFTRAEATKWIKRAQPGTRFALHVRIDAHIVGDENHVYRDGCLGSVDLTKPQALRLVERLLTDDGENIHSKRIPCSRLRARRLRVLLDRVIDMTPFKFIIAGKYGFLHEELLDARLNNKTDDQWEPPVRDVRDAYEFDTFDEAHKHRFMVTDGKVLMVCSG